MRLIFPAPVALKDRLEASWHKNRDKSLSAAIRRLLDLGLASEAGK